MMNMEWEALEFELPIVKGRRWYRAVDTGQASPNDFLDSGKEEHVDSSTYRVGPHSVVVLLSR